MHETYLFIQERIGVDISMCLIISDDMNLAEFAPYRLKHYSFIFCIKKESQ